MNFQDKYKKLIYLLVLLFVILLGTIIVKHYFKPIIFMIIIVILCNPIYKFMLRLNIPSKLSGALSIFLINMILLLTLITLGNSIINLIVKLYYSNIEFIQIQIIKFGEIFEEAKKMGLMEKLFSVVNNVNLRTGALNTGEGIIAYFIGNIGAFFLLTDKGKINSFIKLILPEEIIKKGIKQKKAFSQLITLQIIFVIISSIEIIIGFTILKVENSVLLGVICGILDLLPYVGTIIVFIPIIIYNIIVKDYIIAFGLICLYILVQIVREFLEAKYLSNQLELHPLLVLLLVYISVKLFGVIGVFVGPMYGILAKEIIYSQ